MLRHMNGRSAPTCRPIDAASARVRVKLPFKTMRVLQCLTDAKAGRLIGADRESRRASACR